MGTNTLPHLVRMLEATDSPFRLRFLSWIQCQRLVKVNFRPARFRRACARSALESLGAAAKPAVPLLVQLAAARDKDVRVRHNALMVLVRLGREAKEAVPGLIEILRAKVEDMEIKTKVCWALAAIGPEAQAAVPALIAALPEKGQGQMETEAQIGGQLEPEVTTAAISLFDPAAHALGRIGPGAKDAIPALLRALDHEDREVCEAAQAALKKIDPTVAAAK